MHRICIIAVVVISQLHAVNHGSCANFALNFALNYQVKQSPVPADLFSYLLRLEPDRNWHGLYRSLVFRSAVVYENVPNTISFAKKLVGLRKYWAEQLRRPIILNLAKRVVSY